MQVTYAKLPLSNRLRGLLFLPLALGLGLRAGWVVGLTVLLVSMGALVLLMRWSAAGNASYARSLTADSGALLACWATMQGPGQRKPIAGTLSLTGPAMDFVSKEGNRVAHLERVNIAEVTVTKLRGVGACRLDLRLHDGRSFRVSASAPQTQVMAALDQ